MTTTRDAVLIETLQLAVPLYIVELRRMLPARRQAIAREASALIAERGDVLQFGGKEGTTAGAFNALAKGLAAAAYQPGGVKFAGQHWCTDDFPCEHWRARRADRPLRRPIVDLELPA